MSEDARKAHQARVEAEKCLRRAHSNLTSAIDSAENDKHSSALEDASWALQYLGAAVMHLGNAIYHQTKWECAPYGD